MPTFRPGKPRLVFTLSAHAGIAGAFTRVPWDGYTQDGEFGSHVTGGVTISKDGLYLVEHRHHRDAGTGSATAYGAIMVNGVWMAGNQSASSSADLLTTSTLTDELVAGDVIEAVSVIAQTGGKGFGTRSRLVVVRLGPVRWT